MSNFVEKLKKNWESVKRIIRKNIPIGKVPTNETVDAIYEDLKQGYKIENLGKLFLEGSDFENQLEEKVSNSSTSKTYGWWIRRVMVRKKGLKSLLEVSEEDREYSLNQEDDSFFDKKPDDSVDRSPQKPKIEVDIAKCKFSIPYVEDGFTVQGKIKNSTFTITQKPYP